MYSNWFRIRFFLLLEIRTLVPKKILGQKNLFKTNFKMLQILMANLFNKKLFLHHFIIYSKTSESGMTEILNTYQS